MQNDNANYRQLHDEIVANRMADKDETIAQLRTQVRQMTLAASQQARRYRYSGLPDRWSDWVLQHGRLSEISKWRGAGRLALLSY